MKSVYTVCGYRLLSWIASAAIAALAASPVFGAEGLPADALRGGIQAESQRPDIEGRISLDLRNIDVNDALKFLALKSGLNIIITKNVTGRIAFNVENVLISDVFDIMLRSNGLAYTMQGDIYNVMTEEEYRAIYGKRFSDSRQVKVFRLQYAIPDQAFSLLEANKSDIGRLLVEPESGTVMIMDTPEKIDQAQRVLEMLEQKNCVKIFGLKYARAKDVEEQLKSQLDLKKVGTVKADERNNQIVVQTLPERMKNIEELIAGLDKKTKEVVIDAKIVRIQLTDENSTGIQWEGLFNVAKSYGMTYIGSTPFTAVQASTAAWRSRSQVFSDMGNRVGSYPFSGFTTELSAPNGYANGTKIAPGEEVHIGIVDSRRDVDLLVRYLQTLGKTKILSNPSITVINNHEAKIHVGTRQAYVTTTTTTGSGTKTVSEEVTFVDVGVQLSITPMINDDGYIIMKIKPEVSSVISEITTSSGNKVPIIDTSEAETTVMAKDGSTIFLGGLGRETRLEDSKGVPGIGGMPVIGKAFKNATTASTREELSIILTPFIHDGTSITTDKYKEKERLKVKAPKRFDVFKEEVPPPGVPESLSPVNGALPTKGFKPYTMGEALPPRYGITGVTPPIKDKSEDFLPKGVRSYR